MIRIAITGPECSGKSTLAFELAKHYGVVHAGEYAVEYLEQTKGEYSQEDLDVIAEGQLRLIESVSTQSIVIADTEMLVMKIWSEFKYGKASLFIEEAFQNQKFDLYLLCSPDIPYEDAEFRENPNDRDQLFDLYEQALKEAGKKFFFIGGKHEDRLEAALYAISNIRKRQ